MAYSTPFPGRAGQIPAAELITDGETATDATTGGLPIFGA